MCLVILTLNKENKSWKSSMTFPANFYHNKTSCMKSVYNILYETLYMTLMKISKKNMNYYKIFFIKYNYSAYACINILKKHNNETNSLSETFHISLKMN